MRSELVDHYLRRQRWWSVHNGRPGIESFSMKPWLRRDRYRLRDDLGESYMVCQPRCRRLLEQKTHIQHVSIILGWGDLVGLHVVQCMEFTLRRSNVYEHRDARVRKRLERYLRQPRNVRRYTKFRVSVRRIQQQDCRTYPERKVIRYLLRNARSCNRLMSSFLSCLCPFAHQ